MVNKGIFDLILVFWFTFRPWKRQNSEKVANTEGIKDYNVRDKALGHRVILQHEISGKY